MAEKYCILVADAFQLNSNKNTWKRLSDMFDVILMSDFMANPQKYQKKIQGHLSVHTTLSEEMVASMPKLKVVSNHGVGVDHLDVGMYNRHGVKVGNTPHVLSDCVADQAMALILACARKLLNGYELVKRGQLANHAFFGKKVTGSTLGIVGMGSIGYKVAERALGFRMKVLYHNRNRRSVEEEQRVNATYCSNLDELLSQSDFVLLIMPLTNETKGMIGAAQLQKMKPTAFLINVGRGRLVDHDALVSALKAGQLAGAGLDVTDPRPLPVDHPLLQMHNVTLSPHVGSGTVETRNDMFDMCVENLKAGIEGRPMAAEVLQS